MTNNEPTVVVNAYPTLKEQTATMALGLGFSLAATAVMFGGLALFGWAATKAETRRLAKETPTI